MTLTVAFDMSSLVTAGTGISQYVRMVHGHLARRDDIVLRGFAVGRGRSGGGVGRRYPFPLRAFQAAWRYTGLPRAEWLAGGGDVFHCPGGVPAPSGKPVVLTVHDVLAITHPQFFSDRVRAETAAIVDALQRTSVVVTTCDATADEIHRVTGFDRGRIVVGGLGPRTGERQRAGSPAPVAGDYLLAIGAITWRKGLEVLAAAVARLGSDCPPVLVAGPDGWWADDVKAEVARRDVHRRFRFLGPVGDDEVEDLIRHAAVVCHPSHAEGFGIVCLEAMAVGAPVVATDLPSVREMGGDALSLVPAGDDEAFAAALTSLLASPPMRADLGARGRARAAHFGWDGAAGAALRAYYLATDR